MMPRSERPHYSESLVVTTIPCALQTKPPDEVPQTADRCRGAGLHYALRPQRRGLHYL